MPVQYYLLFGTLIVIPGLRDNFSWLDKSAYDPFATEGSKDQDS